MNNNIKNFECFTGCGEKVTVTVIFTENLVTFMAKTNGSQLTQLFCQTINKITIKNNEIHLLNEYFWNHFSLPIHGSRRENLVACLECIKQHIL